MKKVIITLVAIIIGPLGIYAQKISEDKVPASVISAFKAKFPSAAKTTWEKEGAAEYEADFKLDKTEYSASFDSSGKWMLTEHEIKVSLLPAEVVTAIKKEFPGFESEEAEMVEHAQHGTCYEVKVEKGSETFEALFTASGTLLSKTADDKKDKD